MQIVDSDDRATMAMEAVGRALTEVHPNPDRDELAEQERRQLVEQERQAREDELASLAMEIMVRARQRVGRTKWSTTEGVVKRRIVEALRCLAPDD
jgi:hypothetical protein